MQSAQVIGWDQRVPDGGPLDPGSPLYRHRILAEGDSWFTLGGIPTSNLLFSMRFDAPTIVVNCALPGDTIRHIAEIASNRELGAALNVRFGWRWDLMLLSGGGNDLIDRLWEILLPPPARPAIPQGPADYCDAAAVDALLGDVTEGYRRIAQRRDGPDSPCPGVPIVTHTYARVTPRNSPASFVMVPLKGPWLYPALVQLQVPPQHWNSVSDYLIDRLGDAIASLAAPPAPIPNFFVVETRDVLVRAAPGSVGLSNDWMNEIHPSFQGYAKLAASIGQRVNGLLAP